jgi:LPXTG-motif cell wall-anchored protein
MTKVSVVVLLLTASAAFAGTPPPAAPEIDPTMGIGALALLSGGLLLLRSRRKS